MRSRGAENQDPSVTTFVEDGFMERLLGDHACAVSEKVARIMRRIMVTRNAPMPKRWILANKQSTIRRKESRSYELHVFE